MPAVEHEDPQLALAREIAQFTHDPLGYVLFVFPWGTGELSDSTGPRAWQRKVLNEIGEKLKAGATAGEVIRKAVASGHGVGKSALVAWLIKWALDTFEDTRGVVTANTDTQLRTKTWAELSKWHRLSLTKPWFNLTATALISTLKDHDKDWRIDAVPWSENNTEAFAGLHNKGKRLLLVFDEASAIPPSVWETAEGALTDEGTEIIWCAFGNPTRRKSKFFECFNGQRHRWSCLNLDSRTVEGTNKKQLGQWVEDFGEDSDFVRIRVRGEFPKSDASQLISGAAIDAAKLRVPLEAAYRHAPRVLGVDIARHGDDSTVIIKRQGIKCEAPYQIRIPDLMQIAAEVVEIIENWDPDAVFIDATGIGWGVVDRLRQVGYGDIIYPVQTGERAFSEAKYFNRRAELWCLMRDWIVESGCLPEARDLETDLTAPEYWFDGRNRYVLEKKEDMKERGLASPDNADALALTFHAAIAPRKKVDEPDWTKRLTGIRTRGRPRKHPMLS
jgi:hypothetical protein